MLSTVQDLGRSAYQEFGMPVAGAVDEYSLQVANILVGNSPSEAALELTLLGPALKVIEGGLIAVTGADMEPKINGRPLPMWEAVETTSGDIITFAWAKSGCRSYLAVAGGIDVPAVMGSKSTYIRGGIGGIDGRALNSGDLIRSGEPSHLIDELRRQVPLDYIPSYSSPWEVRVVLGPQEDYFTERGIQTFLSREYRVTNESDRMGCRLEGPKIEHLSGADIISDGIPLGAIQVPGHGQPIVMLADRQTTGGYAKIATVISTDLWKIAQAKPGDIIRFRAIPVDEAQKIYIDYKKRLLSLPELLKINGQKKYYRVVINGRIFDVEAWEIG
ncbi:MAG: biotin-dependent carboxyltransferase family protein [Peptococcaceae bacterium]|nr:biotin-dependent carboxyltransferase family protein [Peptococcaceae bacterium]